MPIPVVVWSKTYVCGLSIGGIAVSNPVEGMDVCLLRSLHVVCSGFCNGLITRPGESYWASVSVCDVVT